MAKSKIYYYSGAAWPEETGWTRFDYYESVNSPRILEFIIPDANNTIQAASRYTLGQYIYAKEMTSAGQLKFFFGIVDFVESQFTEQGQILRITAKDILAGWNKFSLNDDYYSETSISHFIQLADFNELYNTTPVIDVARFTALYTADTGGTVFTAETVSGCNDDSNDLTLLPDPAVQNDAYYYGFDAPFGGATVNVVTATGVPANVTLAYEYWNNVAWTALSNVSDGTNKYGNTGINNITWDIPSDWVQTNTPGLVKYYVRTRISNNPAGMGASPVGRRAWVYDANTWFNQSTSTITSNSIDFSHSKIEALRAFGRFARIDLYNGYMGYYFFVGNQRSDINGAAATDPTAPVKLYYFSSDSCVGLSDAGRNLGVQIEYFDSAFAYDAPAYTNESVAAANGTANDMTLLPAAPAINDAYYFGHSAQFNQMGINIGAQGDGTWTITWEYYNGSAWAALSNVSDTTKGFTAGINYYIVSWTRPTNWATVAVNGTTKYWVRARVSAYTSINTQPLGTQCWINNLSTAGLTVQFKGTASNTLKQMFGDYNFSKYPVELLSKAVTHYSVYSTNIRNEDSESETTVKTALNKEQEEHLYFYEVRSSTLADQNSKAYMAQQGQVNGIWRGEFGIPYMPTFLYSGTWYMVRPGHVIKVINSNIGLSNDMVVMEVSYSEPESIARIKVMELGKGYGNLKY